MSTLRKSEVSTEFMALVGLLMVIFISFMVVIGLKSQDVSNEIAFTDAQKISDSLAKEINFASSIDGYYREFELPLKLANGMNYTVSINNDYRFVEVVWDNYNAVSNIITNNVTGSAMPGPNIIRNIGGAITIES
jgi:hypothetical protein